MTDSPRRWQFSLQALLLCIAGVAVSMTMFFLPIPSTFREPNVTAVVLSKIGGLAIFVGSVVSLIEYGFSRRRGAVVGFIVSVVIVTILIALFLPMVFLREAP